MMSPQQPPREKVAVSGLCSLASQRGGIAVTSSHHHGVAGPFPSEEDERILAVKRARFYCATPEREALYYTACVLTGGLLYMLLSWMPRYYASFRYMCVDCNSPAAEFALIEGADGVEELVSILEADTEGFMARSDGEDGTAATLAGWIPVSERGGGGNADGGSVRRALARLLLRERRYSDPLLSPAPPSRQAGGGLVGLGAGSGATGPPSSQDTPPLSPTYASFAPSLPPDSVRMLFWRYERFFRLPTGNGSAPGWRRLEFGLAGVGPAGIHEMAASRLGESARGAKGGVLSAREARAAREMTYGPNSIDIGLDSVILLMARQAASPFFVFQAFSVIVWFCESYITYSMVIIAITLLSLYSGARQVQTNQVLLRKIARVQASVERASLTATIGGSVAAVPSRIVSDRLAPGDIVFVRAGMLAPCDLIVLSGQLVVSEAMLTGESAPVVKYALPLSAAGEGQGPPPGQTLLEDKRYDKHVLLAGCRVIQAKPPGHPPPDVAASPSLPSLWRLLDPSLSGAAGAEVPVLAMVVRTGSDTAKGRLVRAIQYPQAKTSHGAQQQRDSWAFLAALFVIVVIFVVWYATYAALSQGEAASVIAIRCLDVVTVVIPPALPLALTIGTTAAFARLQRHGVFSTAPEHIVSAGHVDCVCYDKTGTLTTEGDTLCGVIPASEPSLNAAGAGREPDEARWGMTRDVHGLGGSADRVALALAMAGCHSLEELESTGELVGEPLEIEIFGSTGWHLAQRPHGRGSGGGGDGGGEFAWLRRQYPATIPAHCGIVAVPPPGSLLPPLAVLRHFPFDAESRMMSVVVAAAAGSGDSAGTVAAGSLLLLTKGAPESVKRVCRAESVPPGFEARLKDLASKGYRVLACATRRLDQLAAAAGDDASGNGGGDAAVRAPQAELEKEMDFCGFLAMGNQLKPETAAVLEEVAAAGLRQCMITGDNVLTAMAVARDCHEPQLFDAGRQQVYLDLDGSPAGLKGLQLHPAGGSSGSGSAGGSGPTAAAATAGGGEAVDLEAVLSSEEGMDWLNGLSIAVTGAAFSALLAHHEAMFVGVPAWPKEGMPPQETESSPLIRVLRRANVYARAKPKEKQAIIKALQGLGHVVCMVGDGANDSFALKTADVGLSIASHAVTPKEPAAAAAIAEAAPQTPMPGIGPLPAAAAAHHHGHHRRNSSRSGGSGGGGSGGMPAYPFEDDGGDGSGRQRRASTAMEDVGSDDQNMAVPSIAAPFSTPIAHIGALSTLLKEGRGALSTSLVSFRFMLHYGVIQFTAVALLYMALEDLSSAQFIVGDLVNTLPLVILLDTTDAASTLRRGLPCTKLLSRAFVSAILGHVALIVACQNIALVFLRQQSFYVAPVEEASESQTMTALFCTSSFMYLSSAVSLAHTYGGFRAPAVTNRALVWGVAALFLFDSWLFFMGNIGNTLFQMDDSIPYWFRTCLWFWAIATGCLFCLFEQFGVSKREDFWFTEQAAALSWGLEPAAVVAAGGSGGTQYAVV